MRYISVSEPASQDLTIPRTGRPGRIGVLTTKTLVIAGEGGFATTPNGRGAMLRAYDKKTGAEVGALYMPAPQTGSPMTYSIDGRSTSPSRWAVLDIRANCWSISWRTSK
jgi:quinoprotein glucose dehydrogenase